MDFGRLMQGVGGRLLRQLLGKAVSHGINRMGGAGDGKKGAGHPGQARNNAQSADMQKRLNQVMRIGRRFWR
jgi:hypothetical protein